MKRKIQYQEGIVRITARGNGFVQIPDWPKEVEIGPKFLNRALDGDSVKILIHQQEKGRQPTGEILSIVKRAKTRFVGTIERKGNTIFIIPDNSRVYTDFFVGAGQAKELKDGDKVYFELGRWDHPRQTPEAKILKVLGKSGQLETEIQSIAHAGGFIYDFSPAAEGQANQARQNFKATLAKEVVRRRDFRQISTFTIDPETAKDFDDAVSVRKTSDVKGPQTSKVWEIGVHIADVDFFVPAGSPLDREAGQKATSVYLPDRTIPMLPEALSADICSLKPDQERLTYSAMFKVSAEGKILDRWFGRSLIRSAKRFSYQEAQEVLDKGAGKFHQELKILEDLAKIFRQERIKHGAIIFERPELEIKMAGNKPLSIKIKHPLETMKLIEEWMLLANREVATFAAFPHQPHGKHRPFIFRIHEEPDPKRITELSIFAHGLGYNLPVKNGKVSPRDLQKLLDEIEGKPEEGLIEYASLRSMAKAIYSTQNVGHFGLGFRYYTHFTSPIRRFPDILAHRLLSLYLAGRFPSAQLMAQIENQARHSSEREQEAAETERQSVKYMQALYMSERIGQIFEGVISGIQEWGIYVQEKKTLAEGLIHISKLGEDYYQLDQKNYSIIAKKTKKRLSLGDSVKIRVSSASPADRRIDYELVK